MLRVRVCSSDISAYLANKSLKAIVGPYTAIENLTSAWDINMNRGISRGLLGTRIAALRNCPRRNWKLLYKIMG
jgi:hypothetical protein